MEIITLVLGPLSTNCYLVFDEENREGVVIDPGDEGSFINEKICQEKIKPKCILATHGHFDHVLGAEEVRLAFNIPFLIHKKDSFLIKRTKETSQYFLGYKNPLIPKISGFLKQGQEINFGKERLKVLETPGHTPGSVCFISDEQSRTIFTGDTIFSQDSFGRTDFSYGSEEKLIKSIGKIKKIAPKFFLYPGHGEATHF